MVIRTLGDLKERLSAGWSITVKNGRFYVQKWNARAKKAEAEVVAKCLDKHCAELLLEYCKSIKKLPGEKVLQKMSEVLGLSVDQIKMQILGGTFDEEVVEQPKKSSSAKPKTETKIEARPTKAESDLQKKIDKMIVQHFAAVADKRIKYIMKWGLWVETNILPLAPGNTWDEMAKNVEKMLEDIKETVPKYMELKAEVEKLRAENQFLKDLITIMKQRLDPINAIREALKVAVQTGANPEVINMLIQRLLELTGGVMINGFR
ncbi:MAG: hypothetical protein DRP11_05275 [Candidatus Aenigmatarchaeota archaeon]|nr:MAG: hypothetical protein DRP11_05275 [Candidatus Aenigmarchaeota archaeon]